LGPPKVHHISCNFLLCPSTWSTIKRLHSPHTNPFIILHTIEIKSCL
jgi:hypothetical protein